MRIFYSDTFELPLPPGHRFPMAKYRRLREAVDAAGLAGPGELTVPEPASDAELLRVHTRDWVERVVAGRLVDAEIRRIGFPWSPELVERSRRSVGGTIAAARAALADGAAANLAGGTHHAFAGRAGGFCVFNDVAVAVRAMQAEGRIRRALVVDCDVHQGDGTARIFAGDPAVFTLSLHGRGNYPLRKEQSDLDVELDDGADDATYLAALDAALDRVLQDDERRAARGRPFDLALYVAGADPYRGDRLGRLALTAKGLAARDRRVFAACRRADLPVAVVMGGGYAPEVDEIVAIHLATVEQAAALVYHSGKKPPPVRSGTAAGGAGR